MKKKTANTIWVSVCVAAIAAFYIAMLAIGETAVANSTVLSCLFSGMTGIVLAIEACGNLLIERAWCKKENRAFWTRKTVSMTVSAVLFTVLAAVEMAAGRGQWSSLLAGLGTVVVLAVVSDIVVRQIFKKKDAAKTKNT